VFKHYCFVIAEVTLLIITPHTNTNDLLRQDSWNRKCIHWKLQTTHLWQLSW